MTFDLQEFIGLAGLHLPEDGARGRRATTFATGLQHPQEIFGFGSLGIPPGIEADRTVSRDGIDPASLAAICRLAGTGVPVFLGNGTFSEYATGIPVDASEWRMRLDLFERMAQDFGRQLYVLAPDKVNDQAETLARLQLFAFDMHLVALAGANVMLSMVPGDLAHDEFQGIAQDILGSQVIPSFTMREGLARAQEVVDFVGATLPPKIHLGVDDAGANQELLDTLWGIKPDLLVSQDAPFLGGDGPRNASDLPVMDPWMEEAGPDVVDHGDSAKVRFTDAWRGWLVRKAFDSHPSAHQYPHIEAQCLNEMGLEPDPEGVFADELRAFHLQNRGGRQGHV